MFQHYFLIPVRHIPESAKKATILSTVNLVLKINALIKVVALSLHTTVRMHTLQKQGLRLQVSKLP